MSIFIHKDSRVVVQGVTGKEGAFWAKHMKDMGTQVVFGVTPGKEGQDVDGIPVYHSVRRGIKDHPADVAMLFVPPKFTKDAVFEALDAGIKKICTIADGIPLHEAIRDPPGPALSGGARVVRRTAPRASSPWAKPCSAPSPTGLTAYTRRATSGS